MSTPDAEAPTPVADLSYEQARDELVRLVSRIESGQVPLEESMLLWERGEELAAHCQAKLDAAQSTLDRATGEGEAVAEATPGTDGTTDPAPSAPADQTGAGEGSSAGT